MKLTIVLLTIGFLNVSAKGVSQNVTFSGENVALEKVFSEIKKQTGYGITYKETILNGTRPVSIKAENLPLEKFLDLILKDQPIRYVLSYKTILLTRATEVVDFRSTASDLLVSPIRGRVLDAEGTPLAGATVTLKGGKVLGVTNAEGVFSVNVSVGDVLVISSVGFESTDYKISSAVVASSNQQSTPGTGVSLTISLKRKESQLDEVIINKGYYTEKKRLSTGNVSKVTAKEIGNQPVTSPLLALQGKVPGLDITLPASAIPGAAPKIRIRGTNSLRLAGKYQTDISYLDDGNYPLYVIDGVPVSSIPLNTRANLAHEGFDPLSTISPENIESIEVLKDADATAIYGSRGSNGVILITTKNGSKNTDQTNLDVNVYRGFGQISRKLDLLNTQQYISMRREALANDTVPITNGDVDLRFWDQYQDTDWQEILLGGTADITDLQASVSSGNPYTSFRFGGGYHKETLVFPGNFGYYRISGQLALNHSSKNNRFKLTTVTNFGLDNNKLSDEGWVQSALTLAPNAPNLYNDDGSLNWGMYDVLSNGHPIHTWTNPFSYLEKTNESTTRNLVTNVTVGYEVLKGLWIQANAGYTFLSNTNINKIPTSSQPPDELSTGIAGFQDRKRTLWLAEPKISYSKKMGNHALDIIVGTTLQSSSEKAFWILGRGYSSDALLSSLRGAATTEIIDDNLTAYKYTSLYGRIGYNWQQKYLLNLTGRRDGSSRFGANNRFGNFGAVGAAWIFSEEPFIKNHFPALNFGKLRSSYGITGSDAAGDYKFYNLYDITGNSYQGVPGYVPSGLYNPDFSWESTKKLEAGLELSFWNNRLEVEIDWYRNRSSNQLVNYPLSAITGFPSVLTNYGAIVDNSGWEAVLRSTIIKNKNFTWNASLNITLPENKLVKFDGIENSPYASYYKIGQPLSIQWLFIYKGVNPQTGLYEFEDINKDGIINDLDRQLTNPTEPKYYGGLNNTFQCKGFELMFQLQYANRPSTRYLPALPAVYNMNQPVSVLDRWFTQGDQRGIQRFGTTAKQDAFLPFLHLLESSNNREDASFIRLKTLSFGYILPPQLLKRMRFQLVKLFVLGQNLLTLTKYTGLDPETGNSLPPLRMFTAGIQVRL